MRKLRRTPTARLGSVLALGAALACALAATHGARADGPPNKPLLGSKSATAAAAVPVLPANFQVTTVYSGLTNPTAIRFSPDGRIFVAQKNGLLLEFDSLTDTSPTTVADLRTQVDDYWDRGLLGLALDPNFPASPYIYVLYALDAPPGQSAPFWNDACPSPPGPTTDGCVVQGRLSRLTLSGNTATSEQPLVTGWCQQFPSHSVGDLHFGADGALYVTGGEGSNFNSVDYGQWGGSAGSPTPVNPCGDPPGSAGTADTTPSGEGGALRAQSVRRAAGEPVLLNGSLLRVDPATGNGLPSNPLAASSDANARRIVAYGFRNPFRFTIRPGTNDVWVADVGWSLYEEVDRQPDPTSAALNFGWPCYEGSDIQPSYQGAGLTMCSTLYAGGGGTTTTFGTSTPGASVDTASTNLKEVSRYTATAGNVTKVTGYISGLGAASGSQKVRAVLYSDSGGNPAQLLGVSNEVTVNAGQAWGWVDFTFPSPVPVAAGTIWMGYIAATTNDLTQLRYDAVDGELRYNANDYFAGPSNPFGTPTLSRMHYSLYATVTSGGGPTVAAPYYSYFHGSNVVTGDNCPLSNGSSITAISFYNGGSYPSTYNGGLFFGDYSRGCIWFMRAGGNGLPDPSQISLFEGAAGAIVDLEAGPSGDLFYTDLTGGTVSRIRYIGAGAPPVANATATPLGGAVPLTVNFDGSGSSDPTGGTLTYAWDLDGDGAFDDSTAVKPSFVYTVAGSYTARLKVTSSNGGQSSVSSPLTIAAGTPPVPQIDAPLGTLAWKVGDTIAFSGGATDAQDGTEPASRLSWTFIMHHCPTPDACHTHEIQTIAGVASGMFAAPDHEYPSWIEVALTATDASGLTATTSVRLDPQTVNLTLASAPVGVQLTVDDTTATAPFTKTVIVNSANSISAPSSTTLGGTSYTFSSWSDGGAATHTFIAPATATTFTATYSAPVTRFGVTTPGALTRDLAANTKQVAPYTALVGSVTKVTAYMSGRGSGQKGNKTQPVRAVLYADSAGSPGALLGVSNEVQIHSRDAFAWLDFTFPSPVTVTAGPIWMGFISGSTANIAQIGASDVTNATRSNANMYPTPSNPFGTASTSHRLFSMYATLGS